ncbi:MAG TPA: VanZ family protein [Lachnoclostridium phytofermentans]|uniref:VanZ family protein n=1 Tax=Lachnoclostridium phytofermentans TaxID=66219 RepID=A0A3D2X1E5_9FIRM|nr:VanZ family protein [Lachnoclostridium sp.]HCL00942.1 VanZ family protein [Lachnoclostridium phytofermentans]
MKLLMKENTSKKQRLIAAVPMLLMMLAIFLFSAKTATESDGSSLPIAKALLDIYQRGFGEMGKDSYDVSLRVANVLTRKVAHVTEYGILSILVSFYIWVRGHRGKQFFFLTILISVGYAITDEIHQLFVAGRSGRITDVLIDSIGCILGALFFLLIYHLIKNRSLKKQLSSQLRK